MSILEKIEELLAKPDKFSNENIQLLTREVLEFMQSLQPGFVSKDEEEREMAFKSARLLQERLQKKTAEMCIELGVDPVQLAARFEEPEKAELLRQTQMDIGLIKQAVASPSVQQFKKKKKPKHVKAWLTS